MSASKNKVTIRSRRVGTQNINFNITGASNFQEQFPFTFGVPNAVSSFHGREEEVGELDRLFDISKIAAVHGLGGYGKTELACHYARLRKEKYSGNIVWIRGDTEHLMKESIRDVALELKISDCKERDIKCVTQDVYNYFEGTRVLFVFDNAQDRRSISEFLPQSVKLKDADSVNVLINSQCTTWGDNIPLLPLKELSLENALKVLSAIIGEDKFNSIPKEEWKQLAKTFYCVPLGLQIAAAYVKQRLSSNLSGDFSVLKYIARIQEKNLLLDKKLPVDSDSNYKKSIYSSLYITVENIEKSGDEESKWALDLINTCAYLNPDDITDKLLLNLPVIGGSVDKLEEALGILERYSLIISKERNELNETEIRIHGLVQLFFRYHQEKSQTVTKFYKDALYVVASTSKHFYRQCVHVLRYTNCLEILLESLTVPEKKTMIDDWKLLQVASRAVLLYVMDLLLQHGADVNNSSTGFNETPLFSLMVNADCFYRTNRSSWQNAVRLLFKHNANTAVRNPNGMTILHSAAKWRCPALIDTILKKRQLYVNVYDRLGCTPLHWVCRMEIFDKVEMIRAKECIQALVRRNAYIYAKDHSGRSALHYTAQYGNWSLTQFLTDQFGMDSNMRDYEGNTPLLLVPNIVHSSSSEEKIHKAKKIIETLASRGALMNVQNKNGTGILHLLVRENCMPLFIYLIENYTVNVNIQDHDGNSSLHFLAKKNVWNKVEMQKIIEVVQVLIRKGANINAANKGGVPILSFASYAHNLLLVAYLLEEFQMQVNQKDKEGKTPLFWTVMRTISNKIDQKNVEAIIKLLISKCANPAIKDHKGNTILHYCAQSLNSQLLKFFIDQHLLRPNEQNVDGFTALHFIAEGDIRNETSKNMAVNCIEVLRNSGAIVDLVNNMGLTPAGLETRKNRPKLLNLKSYLK